MLFENRGLAVNMLKLVKCFYSDSSKISAKTAIFYSFIMIKA